jgi:2-haloacid dehalogenase
LNFNDFEVLTFDCYGTLIDWEAGISEALHPVWANHHIDMTADKRLELFGVLESEVERGPYHQYKTVLRMVLEGMGARLGFAPTIDELKHFSESVREWPAFPDSPGALQALRKTYKLGIISNVDDDLFADSARRLQVRFDWVITAQQAKSYKPSLRNFQLAFERIGVPQTKILHVAQSLYHDIAPAKRLGLATVWVNRRQHKAGFGATPPAEARADLEVPDLQSLVNRMSLNAD